MAQVPIMAYDSNASDALEKIHFVCSDESGNIESYDQLEQVVNTFKETLIKLDENEIVKKETGSAENHVWMTIEFDSEISKQSEH